MKEARNVTETPHHASTGYSFPYLDGMRGIAILSVVGAHSSFSEFPSTSIRVIHALLGAGIFGLSLFFVLSGFLISLAVFRIRSIREGPSYLLRRIGKIIPPFYLSIVFFTALWALHGHSGVLSAAFAFATTAAHFSMAQESWFNAPYWSLIVEIHFYLLLPTVCLLARRTRFPKLLTWSLFFLVPFLFRHLRFYPSHQDFPQWYAEYNLLPNALDYFSWGILFAIIYDEWRGRFPSSLLAHSVANAGLVLLVAAWLMRAYLRFRIQNFNWGDHYGSPSDFEISRYMEGMAGLLLLFMTFQPDCLAGRFFMWKPLRYIGLVSYEWYLFHYPIVEIITERLGPSHHSMALILAKMILPQMLSFILAVLIYHFFSAPILDWFKARAKELEPRYDRS